MSAIGKLRIVQGGGHAAYCPGCQEYHVIRSNWRFNGNYESPAFTPSLLLNESDRICHAFITDGHWQFLGDCTHGLKGHTVALRDESGGEQQI